jgi:hypothetical protein
MGRHSLRLTLAAALLGAGCGAPTGESNGALTVESDGVALRLHNGSIGRVHYMVVERSTLALINWAPCTGDGCPVVDPLSTVVVPFGEILGYTPQAREAVVYWWPATSAERLQRNPDLIEWVAVPF